MRTKEAIFVVGCGSIGRRHIRNLRSLGVTNIVAYDVDPKSLAQAVAESSVAPVNSLEGGLKVRPKAVLVCTPPHMHTEAARKAVEAGAHVFMEKPIADTMDGLDELLEAAARGGRVVMVGYNLRFHADLLKAKALIDSGAVGKILTLRAEFGQYLPDWRPSKDYRNGYMTRRSTGGGIILDGSHELDYVRWLGGEVENVYAMAGKLSDLAMETEDTALILLRMRSSVLAEVHLDCVQRGYRRGCKVIGSEGTLTWESKEGVKVVRGREKAPQAFPVTMDVNETYLLEMQHFLACMEGRATPPVDGNTGRRVLEIALAAKQSASQRKEVFV